VIDMRGDISSAKLLAKLLTVAEGEGGKGGLVDENDLLGALARVEGSRMVDLEDEGGVVTMVFRGRADGLYSSRRQK
jgi:hypothetical protein